MNESPSTCLCVCVHLHAHASKTHTHMITEVYTCMNTSTYVQTQVHTGTHTPSDFIPSVSGSVPGRMAGLGLWVVRWEPPTLKCGTAVDPGHVKAHKRAFPWVHSSAAHCVVRSRSPLRLRGILTHLNKISWVFCFLGFF